MSAALALHCHDSTPRASVDRIEVWLARQGTELQLEYCVSGEISALRVPAAAAPARTDGLWQHSCCELFLADAAGAGYREFNFSPSGSWAAYQFSAYRAGMQALPLDHAPQIITTADAGTLRLQVRLHAPPLAPFGRKARVALAAVIETHTGTLSYWALRHPPGRADFHQAAGFVELEL
jgi:hypothetical protein